MTKNTKTKQTKYSLPLLDDFLLNLQTNNYSDKTIYNYERDLKLFEIFLNEIKTPFSKINKKTIQQYKAYLISKDRKTPQEKKTAQKLTSRSINRFLSALRSYLKYLIDLDEKVPIPPEAIKLVKQEKKHPQVPEFEDLIKLIKAPSTLEKNQYVAIRNRAMLEVLFATGLRISELVNLRLENIDKEGKIFVRGKGKKERFVYLTPRAFRYLKEYLTLRKDASPYVFVPLRGKEASKMTKKVSANYVQKKIKKYWNILGLNIPITAHSFRHAFATYLAEEGASPAAIQTLLGHESLNTTTRYVSTSDRFARETHRRYHPLKE